MWTVGGDPTRNAMHESKEWEKFEIYIQFYKSTSYIYSCPCLNHEKTSPLPVGHYSVFHC